MAETATSKISALLEQSRFRRVSRLKRESWLMSCLSSRHPFRADDRALLNPIRNTGDPDAFCQRLFPLRRELYLIQGC